MLRRATHWTSGAEETRVTVHERNQYRVIESEQLDPAMNAPRGGAILRKMFLTKSASPIASIWIMTTCTN